MRFLIDTHIFIWFINGDNQLPSPVLSQIENPQNTCMISIASIWEMGIKYGMGRLELNNDFSAINRFLYDNSIQILPVNFEHIQKLTELPFHHRDPFDRVIIAQAISEQMSIITKDELFSHYSINILWT